MNRKKKKKLISFLGILLALGLIYVGILQFKISQYSHMSILKNADYLIVLGARVKGATPSLALKNRINAAANYLKNNENTIAIASGGKGPGEDITEAQAIKEALVKKGIDESRIILENRSTSTYENIKYSKTLIPKKAKLGLVVTNTFHVYRATMMAKAQGLHLHGIPAKTPKVVILKSYIREYLAITKYYLTRE